MDFNLLTSEMDTDRETMKGKFYEVLSKEVVKYNSARLDVNKYRTLFEDVKSAKLHGQKQNRDYWLLRHYDVISVGGKEHLIAPVIGDIILYYVVFEEVFDILYDIHQTIRHGGRDRMRVEVHKRYKNITINEIQTFINICEPCSQKRKSDKRGLVVKSERVKLNSSRCQVDIIDYQSQPDGDFRFVFVYQDHLTKFVILRALKSEEAEEVAHHILDIFLLFGAPSIIQSNNGREFCNSIVEILKSMWPELKISPGKPRPTQSQGSAESVNQVIENMLTIWMMENRTTDWSRGLGFVQFMKNRAHHTGIKQSPHGAMFRHSANVGMATSPIHTDHKSSNITDLHEDVK